VIFTSSQAFICNTSRLLYIVHPTHIYNGTRPKTTCAIENHRSVLASHNQPTDRLTDYTEQSSSSESNSHSASHGISHVS